MLQKEECCFHSYYETGVLVCFANMDAVKVMYGMNSAVVGSRRSRRERWACLRKHTSG
jgi:hypothetical protein